MRPLNFLSALGLHLLFFGFAVWLLSSRLPQVQLGQEAAEQKLTRVELWRRPQTKSQPPSTEQKAPPSQARPQSRPVQPSRTQKQEAPPPQQLEEEEESSNSKPEDNVSSPEQQDSPNPDESPESLSIESPITQGQELLLSSLSPLEQAMQGPSSAAQHRMNWWLQWPKLGRQRSLSYIPPIKFPSQILAGLKEQSVGLKLQIDSEGRVLSVSLIDQIQDEPNWGLSSYLIQLVKQFRFNSSPSQSSESWLDSAEVYFRFQQASPQGILALPSAPDLASSTADGPKLEETSGQGTAEEEAQSPQAKGTAVTELQTSLAEDQPPGEKLPKTEPEAPSDPSRDSAELLAPEPLKAASPLRPENAKEPAELLNPPEPSSTSSPLQEPPEQSTNKPPSASPLDNQAQAPRETPITSEEEEIPLKSPIEPPPAEAPSVATQAEDTNTAMEASGNE